MKWFSDQQILEMRGELGTLTAKYQELVIGYMGHCYLTDRGKGLAMRGFIRRVHTMKHAVEMLFATMPPEYDEVPSESMRKDAEIIIQTFVIHLFGCGDNLATIWVEEARVTKEDGSPIPRNWIGLGTKYTTIRKSLPAPLLNLLNNRREWFVYMESLRHTLAHRIPLYIPPYSVAPENEQMYLALEQQIKRAVLDGDVNAESALRQEQRQLTYFRPWVVQEEDTEHPLIRLHPQMIADFNTVHELGLAFLAGLKANAQVAQQAG